MKSPKAKTKGKVASGGKPLACIKFSNALNFLRDVEGYTIREMAEISRQAPRCIDRWINGTAEPTAERQAEFLAAMTHPRAPISYRKIAAHNLSWDKEKHRWMLRVTVVENPLYKGDRKKIILPTRDIRQALVFREVILAALHVLKIDIQPRKQNREGKPLNETSPTVAITN